MANPRGGQYFLNARRRRRGRRNPARRGGGTNWLLIGGLAAGAFFLLPKLASAGGIFGSGTTAVPAGYTPIGSGLYRSPTGQVVARNPQTGQMVAAPVGSQPTSAEDLLTRAGISLIPSVANTLASWVSGLFQNQQTATGSWGVPSGPYEEWGGALPESGSIFGDAPSVGGALPPLPYEWGGVSDLTYDPWGGAMPSEDWLFASELPPITEIPTYPMEDWGYYDYGDPSMYDLPGMMPVDYDVMIGVGSGDVTIMNPDEWYGYMGLGQRSGRRRRAPLLGFRATPPVY